MEGRLNRDFAEMLAALSEAGAELLVVGAYAMAAHGWPRATGDIDIWVRPSPQNAARVLEALSSFGAPLFDLTKEDLVKSDTVLQLGVPPSRIDILTGISGVTFEEAWAARIIARVEGMDVPVIGFDQLLVNKASTGRPKDAADVAWLRSGRPTDE